MYSPFTKITCMLTFPPCLFGAVSKSYLGCCLWAAVLILPRIKLNWQLSRCAFFSSRHLQASGPHIIYSHLQVISSREDSQGYHSPTLPTPPNSLLFSCFNFLFSCQHLLTCFIGPPPCYHASSVEQPSVQNSTWNTAFC